MIARWLGNVDNEVIEVLQTASRLEHLLLSPSLPYLMHGELTSTHSVFRDLSLLFRVCRLLIALEA